MSLVHQQTVSRGQRLLDTVVLVVLLGLSTVLMVGDIVARNDPTVPVPPGWSALPVFLLAVVPLLLWRRDVVLAVGLSCGAMAAHVLLYGDLVRCGAGLPLAFTFALLAGVGEEGRRALWAGGLTLLLAVLVLVRDTAAGIEILPFVLAIGGVLWLTGRTLRHRTQLSAELAARTVELEELRDQRAALEVADSRASISSHLETLVDERLRVLEEAAAHATGEPDRDRALLVDLEQQSRATLEEMRGLIGVLRGEDLALAPAPSVASLDGLLAQRGLPPLLVHGTPRSLPTSVELSAYRIAEHLLDVLGDTGTQVGVVFGDDLLELSVVGNVASGSELRAALLRARERARLHHGELESKVTRGRARVNALLPVQVG